MPSFDPPFSSEPSDDGHHPQDPTQDEPSVHPADRQKVISAEISDDKEESDPGCPTRLPQPNLGFAILWSGLPIVAQLAVVLIVAICAAGVFVAVTKQPLGEDVQGFQAFMDQINLNLLPLGTFTTALVAVAVSRLMLGRHWVRRLGWRNMAWPQWCCVLLMVAPLAITASEVGNCVSMVLEMVEPDWLRSIREANAEVFLNFVQLHWWFVFVGGCLLPGVGEEIYCRGFISRGLVARHGVILGTLLAAFLFGAMHLDPLQSLTAFLLGIGLQFVFLTTRSLLAPILVHTLNNAAAFATMRYYDVFPIPGVSRLPEDSVVHTPPFLMVTTLAALLATSCLLFQIRTRWRLPDGLNWSPGYVSAEVPPDTVPARVTYDRPHRMLLLATILAQLLLVVAIIAANRSAG